MMRPPHFIIKYLANRQQKQLISFSKKAKNVQKKVFFDILAYLEGTELSQKFGLDDIESIEDFNNRTQLTTDIDYQEILEEIKKNNRSHVIEKGRLKYLAKTSGSTKASKYIPYTDKLIKQFKRFSTNVVIQFCHINQSYDIFDQHILVSPGVPVSETNDQGLTIGYASGIMTMLAPKFSRKIVKPSLDIMNINSLEEKVSAMVQESIDLDIRSFSSMPTFAIPVFEELFKQARQRGENPQVIQDIWPNFRMYVFSGTSVRPYEEKIRSFIGENTPIYEVYSSTETPFAYQYSNRKGELALDLKSAFFQFQKSGSALDSERLTVDQVELGVPYRILMTTYGGLVNYRIGDLVEFVSKDPILLKVLGREKEELNIVGNERIPRALIDQFVEELSKKYEINKNLFFICPYFNEDGKRGYHWCFERVQSFEQEHKLLKELDDGLKEINSNYKLNRNSNTRLEEPKLSLIPMDSIDLYIKSNKQFGQGKFLAIHNTIDEADKFFKFMEESGIEIETFSLEGES